MQKARLATGLFSFQRHDHQQRQARRKAQWPLRQTRTRAQPQPACGA
jgi:hypothetical protein